jgi:hypothetical protein
MKTIALPFRNSVQCLFALVPLLLVCFWLPARAHAVSPTPDGAYSGANTAEGGSGALFSLTTGTNNTALGSQALFSLTIGSQNTATGAQALKNNFANGNTADGFQALVRNTTGTSNTATGWFALSSNTTGGDNTANGGSALSDNTTGDNNTATGAGALSNNTTGSGNTATGWFALSGNVTGSFNMVDGVQVLFNNLTGSFNTACGINALGSNTTGNNNIALGNGARDILTTGDNNIDIGNEGVAAEVNTIRVGIEGTQTATFIAGISGATVTGTAVVVDGNGQLGVAPSSARFKDEIKPMNKASEAILALKPVVFRYKKEIDPTKTAQFGLVAEDVDRVNPDLVARDREGKPFTVRYDAVNAMLLNEFLKEHRKVEQQDRKLKEQEATISELKQDLQATAARQQKQIEALSAVLQKVSAKLEVNNPGPQIVWYSQ